MNMTPSPSIAICEWMASLRPHSALHRLRHSITASMHSILRRPFRRPRLDHVATVPILMKDILAEGK